MSTRLDQLPPQLPGGLDCGSDRLRRGSPRYPPMPHDKDNAALPETTARVDPM